MKSVSYCQFVALVICNDFGCFAVLSAVSGLKIKIPHLNECKYSYFYDDFFSQLSTQCF